MTTTSLHRTFTTILVVLLCWPFAHFALARAVGLDPWKLFGLAMYSSRYRLEVQLWDESRQPAVLLEQPGLNPETQEAIQDLRSWRRGLGTIASVDPFARDILSANPGIERLEVRLGVQRFDVETSKLRTTWTSYRYETHALTSSN